MRGTLLKRTTELKRKTRLRQQSNRTAAKELRSWRRQEAEAVHGRVRCQSCGGPGTEAHHPFGRNAEPWGSSRLVQVLLCRSEHDRVTGRVGSGLDTKLRDRLRHLALETVRAYINQVRTEQGTRHTLAWLDGEDEGLPHRFTYVVSVAEANGIEPPFFGSATRRKP